MREPSSACLARLRRSQRTTCESSAGWLPRSDRNKEATTDNWPLPLRPKESSVGPAGKTRARRRLEALARHPLRRRLRPEALTAPADSPWRPEVSSSCPRLGRRGDRGRWRGAVLSGFCLLPRLALCDSGGRVRVVPILSAMTPHDELKHEVGVREFHDHLSRYVRHAADGGEVIVTMRGKRIARLAPVDQHDPLEDLRMRGLVSDPSAAWRPRRRGRVRARPAVSDLVADQRR